MYSKLFKGENPLIVIKSRDVASLRKFFCLLLASPLKSHLLFFCDTEFFSTEFQRYFLSLNLLIKPLFVLYK